MGRVHESILAARKEIACNILDGIYTSKYKLITLKADDPIDEIITVLSKYFRQNHLILDDQLPPSITLHRPPNTIEPYAPEYVRRAQESIDTALLEISKDTLMDNLRTCYRVFIFKPGDPRGLILGIFAEHFEEGSLSILEYAPGGINYYPRRL